METIENLTMEKTTVELMREARRLLCYADLSVKEIAADLGFEDEKYFNRLFRKVIGTSPGAFRNKMQL